MWQLLDDMGKNGQSVCSYAKAAARVAYEPWFQSEKLAEEKNSDGKPLYADWMTFEEAKIVVTECEQ